MNLRAWPLALLLVGAACAPRHPPARRVIVLGVDGMDPAFLERHWDALPNLDRLRRTGQFQRLRTTTPPQSPVAWSTFATGEDPAQHGLFDFLHRDPHTMQPFSSLAGTEDPGFTVPIGPWALPLSRGHVRSFRKGRTFWEILGEHDVPSTIIRIPANYPAEKLHGHALAGMGVPDLSGTFGTFTLYTDDPVAFTHAVNGGRVVKVNVENSHAELPIEGPANTLRRDRRAVSIPLVVDVDPSEPVARFSVQGEQFILKQGEWSGWIRVRFPLIPRMVYAHGIIRVYAGQLQSGFRLYVSPVNVDPAAPDLPISWPEKFSGELAQELGPFYTQGIREDTAALREDALSLDEYLAQSRSVFDEDLAALRHELRRFQSGVLFFYFSSIDQNSHMLWGKHEHQLLETYRNVDGAIGEVLRMPEPTNLIVMSDHGFAAFNRAVNLNTWLLANGFLALDESGSASSGEMFDHVDWKRTKAYALGLNALYLNLVGREKNGVVARGSEADRLLQNISERLLAFRDPDTGQRTVVSVDRPASQPSEFAPDLIVGFRAGYRASWAGALGAVEPAIVAPNTEAWIGDHCMAPSEVPGVLLTNRKTRLPDPELKDLTVTLLRLYGIEPPGNMSGRNLF